MHAKSDAEAIAVRPLLDRPNVTLLVNAEVERLQTDPGGGAVTGVVVTRGGEREIYEADVVAVCAGAANSARILLRSDSDRHPDGLANGSDQVGRNYMCHNSKAIVALGAEDNDTVFQKTLGLNDFYLPGNGRQWPLGNIQMLGKSNAMAMKGEEPKLTKLAPRWSMAEVARHAVDFWLTTEDIARAGQPGHRRPRRERSPGLPARPTTRKPTACTTSCGRSSTTWAWPSTTCCDKNFYMSMDIPVAARRAPGRHLPVRHRPGHLGARRELQGPRAGQPVRRGHQLLPEHRRGEPGR